MRLADRPTSVGSPEIGCPDMAFVITQRCCNDASCVSVCPGDCIRPSPDDPEFGTAEMLHIDPKACVDCGACVPVCPTSAIDYEVDLPEPLKRCGKAVPWWPRPWD